MKQTNTPEQHRNLGELEYRKLIDQIIEKAKQQGWTVTISIWEDKSSRDMGMPIRWELQEYIDAFEIEVDPEEDLTLGCSLRWSLEYSFGCGGCTEILVATQDEEYAVYHLERRDEYVQQELFDLLNQEY